MKGEEYYILRIAWCFEIRDRESIIFTFHVSRVRLANALRLVANCQSPPAFSAPRRNNPSAALGAHASQKAVLALARYPLWLICTLNHSVFSSPLATLHGAIIQFTRPLYVMLKWLSNDRAICKCVPLYFLLLYQMNLTYNSTVGCTSMTGQQAVSHSHQGAVYWQPTEEKKMPGRYHSRELKLHVCKQLVSGERWPGTKEGSLDASLLSA